MSKRLFGTDGIRGIAGDPPLDPASVRRFGAALAEVLLHGEGDRLVLGRDTRESGPWLRDAVARGAASRGARCVDAGVITTPGLADVVAAGGFGSGVMISASHNPFHDNGLKVFGRDGRKLPDELEAQIEQRVLDRGIDDPGEGATELTEDAALVRGYVERLERLVPRDLLGGRRIVLDCANGSATGIAPSIFRDLDAEVVCIGNRPDGRNINLDCGSLHLDALARTVTENSADVGIAFDGDADRALAVDRQGRPIDGDAILFITARRMHRAGRLPGNAVVSTVMSNLWLEQRLAELGIELHRAAVGDKYVLERMLEEGLVLGGEQSGHVIFGDHATTGDGILTALMMFDAVAAGDESLESIVSGITPCPQIQLNVRVREKPDLWAHPAVGPAVAELERTLGRAGRVVLRYSGTEPLARVMVEGENETTVRRQAEGLADVIRTELGE